jgi:hypothetical protein
MGAISNVMGHYPSDETLGVSPHRDNSIIHHSFHFVK